MKTKALIALVSLIGLAGFSQITCDQVKTVDGRTFRAVTVRRVEPDGISISYEPATGGIGMAKLKFAVLPESMRQQFGYDAEKASAYETEQLESQAALAARMQHDSEENANRLALKLAKEKAAALEEEKQARIAEDARNRQRWGDSLVEDVRRRTEMAERIERRRWPLDSPSPR